MIHRYFFAVIAVALLRSQPSRCGTVGELRGHVFMQQRTAKRFLSLMRDRCNSYGREG
jgi:hypothetical protein